MWRPRLEIAGTPYRLLSVVHFYELKQVKVFPERSTNLMSVNEADRVDFDLTLLSEDRWKINLDENEFVINIIGDVRSGQMTCYGRVHR